MSSEQSTDGEQHRTTVGHLEVDADDAIDRIRLQAGDKDEWFNVGHAVASPGRYELVRVQDRDEKDRGDAQEQALDDLEWGKPDRGMGHHGPHQPAEAGDEVVCVECGAVAENGIPEAWP